MKQFWQMFTVVLLAGAVTYMAAAQVKDGAIKGEKPGGVVVDVVKWTGTVKAVDAQAKTVTVEGPGGKSATINAKNARNLDQVKVGDKVNIQFTDELALFVRKSGAPPAATEAQVVQLAPKGEKPAGLMAKTIELTGSVQSIDSKNRTIDLKGPAGNVRTYKVDKAVKNFDQIKKGDQVVLRFTEAVALSVVKS